MASIEYKDPSLGLTVGFDFAVGLLHYQFSENIWLSIARVIIKALDKVLLQPIKNFIFHVNQFREDIIIEWEASKARIKARSLVEVAKIYEQEKAKVERESTFSYEAKQKLIARLDRSLDLHMDKIVEYA